VRKISWSGNHHRCEKKHSSALSCRLASVTGEALTRLRHPDSVFFAPTHNRKKGCPDIVQRVEMLGGQPPELGLDAAPAPHVARDDNGVRGCGEGSQRGDKGSVQWCVVDTVGRDYDVGREAVR